jgi:hypothetical protein
MPYAFANAMFLGWYVVAASGEVSFFLLPSFPISRCRTHPAACGKVKTLGWGRVYVQFGVCLFFVYWLTELFWNPSLSSSSPEQIAVNKEKDMFAAFFWLVLAFTHDISTGILMPNHTADAMAT